MSRARLAEKIRALRAKTRAAGCTEAEALAAAEMAARLMREHNIDAADLEMAQAEAREKTVRPTWRTTLHAAIAYCTNTVSIKVIGARGDVRILFIGRAPGPEIALYLRDVCYRAVDKQTQIFKESRFYKARRSAGTRRAAAADFVDGMVLRLSARLIELFDPLKDDAAREQAKAVLNARYPNTVALKQPERSREIKGAADAGWRAGGDIDLNRGVGGERAPLRIGGGS